MVVEKEKVTNSEEARKQALVPVVSSGRRPQISLEAAFDLQGRGEQVKPRPPWCSMSHVVEPSPVRR